MPSLNPKTAHNAAAALVEMYAGIIGDYERREMLLRAQIESLKEQLAIAARVVNSGHAAQVEKAAKVDAGSGGAGRDPQGNVGAVGSSHPEPGIPARIGVDEVDEAIRRNAGFGDVLERGVKAIQQADAEAAERARKMGK